MKITIEFRNPTPSHCDVAVFINGANTGTLRLRQEELFTFQEILFKGAVKGIDTIISKGNPNYESQD